MYVTSAKCPQPDSIDHFITFNMLPWSFLLICFGIVLIIDAGQGSIDIPCDCHLLCVCVIPCVIPCDPVSFRVIPHDRCTEQEGGGKVREVRVVQVTQLQRQNQNGTGCRSHRRRSSW